MSFIQIIYSDELSEGLPEENQDETSTLLDDTDVLALDNTNNTQTEHNFGLSTTLDVDNLINIAKNTERTSNIGINSDWSKKETNYLLKKYNKYIVYTGPRKRFRTKRELWKRISQDMNVELNANRSASQCENRYKTVLRRWRRQMKKTGGESVLVNKRNEEVESVLVKNKNEEESIFENKPSTTVIPSETVPPEKNTEKLGDVLWEIFKRKEEGRERRHKEKMELIKSLLQNFD